MMYGGYIPVPCRPVRSTVEPDLSNAGPFLAAAVATGGEVTFAGWPQAGLQASAQILDVADPDGRDRSGHQRRHAGRGHGAIHGITADLGDISELAPPLVALAALADSPSTFTGIGHMRTHEMRPAGRAGERDRQVRRRRHGAARRPAHPAAAAAVGRGQLRQP